VNPFVKKLSSYLKDMPKMFRYKTDREDFEKAIDQAPHDALNHLVYADWLDENGEPDEAAFRRSMGKWIEKNKGMPAYHPITTDTEAGEPALSHPYRMREDLPNSIDKVPTVFPEGINTDDLSYYFGNSQVAYEADGQGIKLKKREPHDAHWHPYRHEYSWPTYRAMEEAMRRAFMKGRKKS